MTKIKIPLSKPDITDLERKAVLDVLKTPQLSLGKNYIEFQNALAKFAGVKYAVATNSGTSALHLIIKALGIGKGDEVITTPFSFIASSNCILFEGAKPVFIDIDPRMLNIDVSKIEEKITSKTKAILAVDVFSHPAEWQELEKIAKKHQLFLIEDSAESLGSEYKGKRCGSFGDAAIFAFYPNKQITTGEGGVVLTSNKKLADLCRSMANQGREPHKEKWLKHIRLGYNYRLDEMSCALGLAQLKRIKEILKKRARVAELFNKKLKHEKNIEIPYEDKNCKLSWFVYVITLAHHLAGKRDSIIAELGKRGIQCNYYFQSIHLQPFYREMFGFKEGDFPISEDVSKRTIALPFFSDLQESEIDIVVRNLQKVIKKYAKSY